MSWLDLLNPGGRLLQGLGALGSIYDQNQQQNQYTQDVDAQIAEAMAQANLVGPQVTQAYGRGANRGLEALSRGLTAQREGAAMNALRTRNSGAGLLSGIMGRGSDLIGRMRADEAGILRGYGDRYKFAADQLEGYGRQQAEDINRGFAESDANIRQDLLNRGLLSSTEANTQFSGNQERRSAEQRRLGEDLVRNRVGLLSGLSGEGLAARERLSGNRNATQGALNQSYGAYDAAIRDANLAAQRGVSDAQANTGFALSNWFGTDALNRANLAGQGGDRILNTIMGINRVPPPSNAGLLQQFGANMVQPAQPQGNWFSSLLGGASPGIGSGVGSWLAGAGGGASGGTAFAPWMLAAL